MEFVLVGGKERVERRRVSSRGRRFDSFNPPKAKAWRSKLYLISVHKDKEAGGARGGSDDHLVPSLNVVFQ